MIITIDGSIATGKSSIAKKLAQEVGYIYFDTGAMYRCLTYGLLKNKINIDNPEELNRFLQDFKFDTKIKQGEKRYFVDGEDVSDNIRLNDVTSAVSKVSAVKAVREKLVAMQREFSKGVNAVFEGRDMGTVVFPHAEVKIFLTGKAEVRAKRRYDELRAKYPLETKELTLEQTLEEITQRDAYDTNREISPLRRAEDAYVIDTSDLSLHDIVLLILEYKDSLKTRRPQPGDVKK